MSQIGRILKTSVPSRPAHQPPLKRSICHEQAPAAAADFIAGRRKIGGTFARQAGIGKQQEPVLSLPPLAPEAIRLDEQAIHRVLQIGGRDETGRLQDQQPAPEIEVQPPAELVFGPGVIGDGALRQQ